VVNTNLSDHGIRVITRNSIAGGAFRRLGPSLGGKRSQEHDAQ
jgi:hypothetical protein